MQKLKQNTVLANLPEREEISIAVENQSINTREELAKMADVSPRNMAKIEKLVDKKVRQSSLTTYRKISAEKPRHDAIKRRF